MFRETNAHAYIVQTGT